MTVEVPHLVGVILAVITSVGFAVGLVFARLGVVAGNAIDGVYISLLTNTMLVIGLVLVFGGMQSLTPIAVLWFTLAGVAGLLLAQLSIFKSVELIGASRTSPVVSASVFISAILGVVLFGESLTVLHTIGIIGIAAGVAVISWDTAHEGEHGTSFREVGVALLLPLLAALFAGIDPVLIAMGLREGAAILPGVAVQAMAAVIGLTAYLLAIGWRGRRILERSSGMLWFVGTGVANTIGMVAYFGALQVAPIVIVVPLVTTSPLVVMLVSYFLPRGLEHLTWRLVGAALVVVIGASVVGLQ